MVSRLFAKLYHLQGYQAQSSAASPTGSPATKKRKVSPAATKAALLAGLTTGDDDDSADDEFVGVQPKGTKAKAGTGYEGNAVEDVIRFSFLSALYPALHRSADHLLPVFLVSTSSVLVRRLLSPLSLSATRVSEPSSRKFESSSRTSAGKEEGRRVTISSTLPHLLTFGGGSMESAVCSSGTIVGLRLPLAACRWRR